MEVTLIESMGTDLSVVNAARVSFHKESCWGIRETSVGFDAIGNEHFTYDEVLDEKDAKLINYLAKHGHWTPFGHAFLSFRIKAPIFVARQLVKHQVGLCWNEVSRRYVSDEPEFFQLKWRWKPDGSIKQGSGKEFTEEEQEQISNNFWSAVHHCWEVYEWMIQFGVAPEQARAVLNLNSMTEWIWSGSLAAFARVCKLRLDPHAQAETREIAEKINAVVPDSFSHSWSALLGTHSGAYPESDSTARKLLTMVNG